MAFKNIIVKGLKFKCIKDVLNPSGCGFFAKAGDIVECYEDGWLINSSGLTNNPYCYTASKYFEAV